MSKKSKKEVTLKTRMDRNERALKTLAAMLDDLAVRVKNLEGLLLGIDEQREEP